MGLDAIGLFSPPQFLAHSRCSKYKCWSEPYATVLGVIMYSLQQERGLGIRVTFRPNKQMWRELQEKHPPGLHKPMRQGMSIVNPEDTLILWFFALKPGIEGWSNLESYPQQTNTQTKINRFHLNWTLNFLCCLNSSTCKAWRTPIREPLERAQGPFMESFMVNLRNCLSFAYWGSLGVSWAGPSTDRAGSVIQDKKRVQKNGSPEIILSLFSDREKETH